MSGFLLDTNVISMLSPSAGSAPRGFLHWLERADASGRVFLSTVTVHEIEKGVTLLEHKGARAKAAGLRAWLSGLVTAYDEKIVGLDVSAATVSGRLEADALAAGHDPGMADAVIAGIAEARGLVIITRNAKHFRSLGADVLSPEDAVSAPETRPAKSRRPRDRNDPA